MIGINLCDVGVAALADLSWITYSVVCEFMCMSKPIIMYREDESYIKRIMSIYTLSLMRLMMMCCFRAYENMPRQKSFR